MKNLPKTNNRAQSSIKPFIPATQNAIHQQASTTTIKSARRKESKSSISKKQKKSSESTRDVESKIQSLKSLLRTLADKIETLIQKNHSYILVDTNFLQKAKNLQQVFQPLFDEIMNIYHKFDACTSQDDYCRISLTTLKQISLHVLQRWKEFRALINLIKNDGLKSLTDYVNKQFSKIERDVNSITTRPRKTCSRTGELLKSGQNIIELMSHNKNAIQSMLIDREIMRNAPDLEETQINDLRNFIKIYNDVAFQMFTFSGYMQTELQAFRTDFNTYCGEILCSIHCGFSFEADMKGILETSDSFHDILSDILQAVKLPEIVIREAQEAKILEENMMKSQPSHIFDKIIEFTRDDLLKTDISKAAKLDLFIDNISQQLGLDIEPNEDITVRLQKFGDCFVEKLNLIETQQRETDSYIKKIHAQSEKIQEMIQDRAETMNLHKEEIDGLQEKIANLKDEISQLEKDKKQQFEQLTHQRQIIFQLRHKNNEITCSNFSNQVSQQMSKIMREVEGIENLIPKDEEVQEKKKMDIFVLEKRTNKTNEYESIIRESKRKIKTTIDLPKNLSFPQAIDYFIEEYNKLKNNFNTLTEEHANLCANNNDLQDKYKKLLQDIAESIRKFGGNPDNIDDPEALIRKLYETIENMKRSFDDKIRDAIQKTKLQLRNEMKELLDMMREIVPDSPNENQDNIFVRKFKVILAKYRTLEYNLNKANNLLKVVEKWMNQKTDFQTDGMPQDQSLVMMMKAIDEMPNPLQPVVDRLETELKLARFTFNSVYKRLAEEKKPENDTAPEDLDLVDISSSIQSMIDDVCDNAHAREFIIKQQKEAINSGRETLRNVVSDLAQTLMHNEIIPENMEYEQLLNSLTLLVHEICSPEGNNSFIAIEILNRMTYDARRFIDSQLPPKPSKYIPVMMEQFVKQARTVLTIERLRRPLKELFAQFDFNYSTFDPHTADFLAIRDKIFALHQIVQQTFSAGLIESNVFVVQRLLALTSLFLSSDVALTYNTEPTKSKAKFRDDLDLIQIKLLV
ncbi:hypothetical protein TVAG_117350 [Trichomonas vaginalis G3]|uniref:Uncharacterized protein n=1 Tax=Trichomonas vaginalis (strain ATCC PRA-98 / G3) TaxID=412133 RepID=A2E3S5_TRIV3|nr:hypothetical protein TVAGG3_0507360 [Trichomonas vaginalis G3]EAY12713.1 hypothetical protein TVAG_117350 [Trichomonas vaginalis G3]KAI5517525.1 hypothetical protein TVAGG3_0507360 [Trichomonas vaginalis G3]|eukprot:XP_001324936.1 hypothetical protein [Trichomonas vaginalis G3]